MTDDRSRPGERTTEASRPRPERLGTWVLVSWSGSDARVHRLPRTGKVDLGRSEEAQIRIVAPSISRMHARLHVDGDAIFLEDLDSRNGSRVHARRLAKGERARLDVGAIAEVGDVSIVVQRPFASSPRPEPSAKAGPDPVVASGAMKRVYGLLDIAAAGDVPVLLLGETGSGKEVLARELHRRSRRARGPQVSLSCAALPEATLESELFGFERGAFTGAVQSKRGLFEVAHGGTLFLDEIGELPQALQAKLLRVLETGEFMRMGSVRPTHVDVRIVSATNRDLAVEVGAGRFRADLYFRINGFVLTVPPLRERRDEILPLARHFLAAAAGKLGVSPPSFTPEAVDALEAHAFPGNVRELKNVVERAILVAAGGTVGREHLDLQGLGPRLEPAVREGREGTGLWGEVDQLERTRILAALEANGGNQTAAARALGIGRTTLVAKLDQYAIARPRKGK